MPVRIVSADAYRRVRWKNGLGWTSEIAQGRLRMQALDDEGASSTVDGEWDWRLSIAEIDADAPFSPFQGVDRTLVLIEGIGLRLDLGNGHRIALDATMPRVDFAGERDVIGHLPAGAVRVLNLMTRRGRVDARVDVIMVLSGQPMACAPGRVVAILAMSGRLRVQAGDAAMPLPVGDTALILPARDGGIALSGEGMAISVCLDACA